VKAEKVEKRVLHFVQEDKTWIKRSPN